MAEIVVVLSASTDQPRADVVQQIDDVLARRGATGAAPVHPASEGTGLDVFYRVEVPGEQLSGAVDDLLAIDGVEGAYVKPLDEAP